MASSRMLALLGLLALAGYQNRDRLGELFGGAAGGRDDDAMRRAPSQTPQSGGVLGNILGGLFGAGSAGGEIRGGLGDLIDKFDGNGQGQTAKSWVETGPNRNLGTSELEGALGDDTIEALTKQTGLSREELLSRLKTVLPDAVDRMTPEGRLPTENEIARWAGR